MMAQNRQDSRDRAENNYVSKIILRNENQSRHINAKIDHLLSLQWKRLMEIQELQMCMFQIQQENALLSATPSLHPLNPLSHRSFVRYRNVGDELNFWAETKMDPFTLFLLRKYFSFSTPDLNLTFSKWSLDGEIILGQVSNVKLNTKDCQMESIEFTIDFDSTNVTMDDLFSGDKTVSIRNDFDALHMNALGQILKIQLEFTNNSFQTSIFTNGDLPSRYKTSFGTKRSEKITDLWKAPLARITISYCPPNQLIVIQLKEQQIIEKFSVQISKSGNDRPDLYLKAFQKSDIVDVDVNTIMREMVGPLAFMNWKKIPLEIGTSSQLNLKNERYELDQILTHGMYFFYCTASISIHAHVTEVLI
jgi:hypothetical protein